MTEFNPVALSRCVLEMARDKISLAIENGHTLYLGPWTLNSERLAIDPFVVSENEFGACVDCGKETYYTTIRDASRVYWCGCGEDLDIVINQTTQGEES